MNKMLNAQVVTRTVWSLGESYDSFVVYTEAEDKDTKVEVDEAGEDFDGDAGLNDDSDFYCYYYYYH